MFKGKIAVVTGGAQGIGKAICEALAAAGATVRTIDRQPNAYFTGDVADERALRAFAKKVLDEHGHIDYLVNNACLFTKGGLLRCNYADFNYVLRVGVSAPFLLTQLFQDHFSAEGAVVNIASTRAFMSQPDTESYSAAKGGICALTHAMAVTLSGRVRVNAVSPGWIDTLESELEPADTAQHPAGRVGVPEDIVHAVLFLLSEKAGFITGQNLTVDGGMTRLMVYHNDFGWKYQP